MHLAISTHISALYFCLIFAISLGVSTACSRGDSRASALMDRAESLMEQRPDSALSTLDSITPAALAPGEQSARYALLRSMALDKNYIDTTDFAVLQPAIDYYPTNGTPDQKLRTYYYQGRIYQNAGNEDSAMQAFMRGRDNEKFATDTLLRAHLLVAQGGIFYKTYKFNDFINNNLNAADLYMKIGRTRYEIKSLAKALNGSVINNDKMLADSILAILNTKVLQNPEFQPLLVQSSLSYIINFGNYDEIKNATEYYSTFNNLNGETILDLIRGLCKIGDKDNAKRLFDIVEADSATRESLKFLAVKPEVLQTTGDTEGALKSYKNFYDKLDTIHTKLFSQDLLFAKKRHELEIVALLEKQNKRKITWISLCTASVLFIIIIFIYYRLRLAKAKALIEKKEIKQLQLEQENLQKEKEKMSLEKQAAELESQNLRLEIAQLESEQYNLKNILLQKKELSDPLKDVIKQRLDMLNSLLAKEISDNDIYAQPYNKWIESIHSDKLEFMNSTRLAFTASHPAFIEYLETHNLTTDEINHLCLYALGLRGKEIGEYMQQKRHYHIISEIRKKLGIDGHQTNIGIYIRQLMDEL